MYYAAVAILALVERIDVGGGGNRYQKFSFREFMF